MARRRRNSTSHNLLLLGGAAVAAYLGYNYFFGNKQDGAATAGQGGILGSALNSALGDVAGAAQAALNPLGVVGQAIDTATNAAAHLALGTNPTNAPTPAAVSPVAQYTSNLNAQNFAGLPVAVASPVGVGINPAILALPMSVSAGGVLGGAAATAQRAITNAAINNPNVASNVLAFGSLTPQAGGGVGTINLTTGQTSYSQPASTLTTTQRQALGLM